MARTQYDETMLEAARNGDRQSILALLVLAQPDLRRYAAQSCGTYGVMDDAVQEALWVVYRRIGALRVLSSFSGWLAAIVRRECLRLVHTLFRNAVPLDDAALGEQLAQRPQLELRMDLTRAIESLPAHYREIVLLRDVEELTIGEIAERLGRTREAIKGNLHRARVLLREYFQAECRERA